MCMDYGIVFHKNDLMTMSTLPAQERTTDEVLALSRGISVLRCLAGAPEALGNRQISELTGVPKATVSRLTATLVSLGLVRQNENTDRFALGAGVLEFSSAYLARLDLAAVARPHLLKLAEHAGAGVLLAARDRLEVVVLTSVRPRSAVVVARVDVGGRLSLTSSALGRAYLAACEPDEREALIANVSMAWPDEWRRAEAGCRASLEQAEALGYCLSLGEWHPELNTAASAFVAPTGDIYAIACGGSPITQTHERLLHHIAPALQRCVQAIASEVGGKAIGPAPACTLTQAAP